MSEKPTLAAYYAGAKTARAVLDKYREDVEEQTEEFRAGDRTIQLVTSYIDTWQYTRGKIFDRHWKTIRLLEEARDQYRDGMRAHLSRGLTGKQSSAHYNEREAVYEMKNAEQYKILRLLEKVDIEMRAISQHLDRKIRWLEDMRRQMRREDDDFRFSSNKDHQGA